MKNVQKLTLYQETIRNLTGLPADNMLFSGFPCHSQASICNICIPPTETPTCNPA